MSGASPSSDDPKELVSLATSAVAPIVAPAASVIADALSGVTERALRGLRLRIYEWREVDKQLFADVDERLARRGVSQPQEPDPAVSFGVLTGTRVTRTELHGLFAELLATAMDPGTAENAHPAFADIIRQLLPDEATLLSHVRAWNGRFWLKALTIWDRSQHVTTVSYLGEAKLQRPERTPVYIANLARLGLVERRVREWKGQDLHFVQRAADEVAGAVALATPAWKDNVPDARDEQGLEAAARWAVRFGRFGAEQLPGALLTPQENRPYPNAKADSFSLELIEVTPLGQQFMDACVPPAVTDSAASAT